MAKILNFIDNSEVKFKDIFSKFAGEANKIDIAVAYAKNSGFELIKDLINKKEIRILFTFDFLTTDPDCINKLLKFGARCKEYRSSGTEEELNFHPKMYIFKNNDKVRIIIGSSNLTGGGFLSNVESCLAIEGEYEDRIIGEILNYFEKLWNSSKAKYVSEDDINRYKAKKENYYKEYKRVYRIVQDSRTEYGYANSVIACLTREHDQNDIYNRLIGVPDGPGGTTRNRFKRWIKKGTRIFIYYKEIKGISKIVEAISDPTWDDKIIPEWRDGFEQIGETYPNRVNTRLIRKFPQPVTFKELKELNIRRVDTGKLIVPGHLQQSIMPISDADGDAIERKLLEKNRTS